MPLRTCPGVFAGGVRPGSVRRVAPAVGEVAVRCVHEVLAALFGR